ncbi:RNA polymerase sigma factor [Streptomyces antimicrobicus]|uniref:Sigma-70 family RNA polymerase sigma factor n=1 Tax=Streptomyces antimicrobicus TaxID=2883108 RepID=A0ABS8BDD8_9ACTN|nr:sigma-70 family RNA polymerase sigma factor [Streptomyces antimicrobicus]MCB5182661.1 sigma-70 family RNA polymerase sigma factor [Streptomyces antimicrobicus]
MTGARERTEPAEAGDLELTRLLREAYAAGAADPAVCDVLYRRHRGAALAYARTCCRAPQDAEDLVSEAFLRTFQAVRAGAGPQGPWRAYLLAVVRNTAVQWRAGDRRHLLTPDFESRPSPAGGDPQRLWLADEDRRLVARSFHTLPERWQAVLWHTLVEGGSPHEVAQVLGITPSAVTSLAFRAREGLREAYLRAHVAPATDGTAEDGDRCRHYGALLGAAVRRGGPRSAALVRHLTACRPCTRAYAELLDLNAALAA